MSDYHIINQSLDDKRIRVIFHIPIPAGGTNSAGISWRDAILREQDIFVDEDGNPVIIRSRLNGISVADDTALKNGSLIEVDKTIIFSTIGLTPIQKKTEIENKYNEVKTILLTKKQIILDWIGFESNVP